MSHKQFGQCLDSWLDQEREKKNYILTQIAIELKLFQIATKETSTVK